MAKSLLTDEYVQHALKLIRVANGLNDDASGDMALLGRELKKLFAGEDLADLGVQDLRSLIGQAEDLIADAFAAMVDKQNEAIAELVNIESKWAMDIAGYDLAASEQAIQRAISQFTVMGGTLEDQLDVITARLQNAVAAQVRLGASAGLEDKEIIENIIGVNNVGGVMQSARRDVAGMVDATTHSAANVGRRLTMKANGVSALQWHAVLDARVCVDCAERADLVWTVDGDPVGHEIPYLPIPLHAYCRCIYLPLELSADELDNVAEEPSAKFAEWLEKLSEDKQDALLGAGRAQLWRDGTISLTDLIDQNGMVMSLTDLKESLK